MIETETIWNDSGYDCDHCGGQILERTDIETGQPAQVCYQCEVCGCQWALSGDVMRVGSMNSCRRAQRSRQQATPQPLNSTRLWVFIIGTVILILGLVFSGGLVAIRFLIPIVLAGYIFYAVYKLGKERMWW